jgi:hypothetical protein
VGGDAVVSYPQAFHTSCRTGLSGHSGFQYNATSTGLDDEQLARIARSHVGYRISPDAPPEPSPEQIAQLPVCLRYQPVDGVGAVVSRTAYVGREFRGGPGAEDSGRFGNYFSHVVVDPGAGSPFGGLLAIELWDAPHWRTEESTSTELERLPGLTPGPVDLEEVLTQLLPRRREALPVVLEAAFRAVLGGPRLVVVEPDPALAAAWIAWACFALPPDRVPDMTFSTFDGRPRQAEAVRLCLTTPDCDVAFAPYELGSTAVVVDAAAATARGAPDSETSLYARVVAALGEAGAEAVAAATRDLPKGLELEDAGAELAVRAGRADVVKRGETARVVTALGARLGRVPAEQLAALAADLPQDEGDPAVTLAWSQLHALARRSDGPGSVAVADESLRRVLGALDGTPSDLAEARAEWPTVPSPGVLADWLKLVTAATGTVALGPALSAGSKLGLVGCNTALDRGLAAPIAAGFGDPQVRRAYEQIAALGNALVVEAVALSLAAAAVGGGPIAPDAVENLRHAALDPVAREAVRAHSEQDGGFDALAAWELLRAGDDPARRASATAELAARAETGAHQEQIRALYGPLGPQGPDEHAELLNGWAKAGFEAPRADCLAAARCLASLPFSEYERAVPLFRRLHSARLAEDIADELLPWRLKFESPPRRAVFSDWATDMVSAGQNEAAFGNHERVAELRALAADVVVASRREDDYLEGIGTLLAGMDAGWPKALGDALRMRIAASVEPERIIAESFGCWYPVEAWRQSLLESALPRATRDTSPKQLEAVADLLPESAVPAWERWAEENPSAHAVSRAVRGVFRRGEGKQR